MALKAITGDKKFTKILNFFKIILLSSSPLVLIFLGSYFIALGSELFLAPLVNSPDAPFKMPSPNFAYFGLLLVILGISLAIFLVRKNKKVALFGWITSLITQAVITAFILTALFSPWFDFFILNFSFQKGSCFVLKYVVEKTYRNAAEEVKEEASTELNTFCNSASKLFNFYYP